MPKAPVVKDVPDAVREYLRTLGSRGGKRGGPARWRGVSKAERSAQMKAVRAQARAKKTKYRLVRSVRPRRANRAARPATAKDA
jgi:hypothetical protein